MKALLRQLIALSWPLALAQAANVAGGILGSVILAQSSVHSLAATLPATMLACTISAFFSSFLGYSGTLVARHDGIGDADAGISSFLHGLGLTALFLPVFALFVPVGHQIFAWFGHTPKTLAAERLYFTYLIFSGYLATLSSVLGGFLTGRGNTRFAGIVMSAGSILNVLILPPLALGNHALAGIHGTGLANLLSNLAVVVILSVRVLGVLRNRQTSITSTGFRPNRQRLLELMRLGIPNGFRQLLDCGGFFVFTALLARLDSISVAASTSLFAVNNLHHAVREGIQRGIEIQTGRLSGTEDRGIVLKIFFSGLLLMAAVMAVFIAIFCCWKQTIFGWFLPMADKSGLARLLQEVDILLPVFWVNLVLEAAAMILTAVSRGLGRTSQLFYRQFLATGVIWLPLVLLVHTFHPSVRMFWMTLPVCSAVLVLLLAKKTFKPLTQET